MALESDERGDEKEERKSLLIHAIYKGHCPTVHKPECACKQTVEQAHSRMEPHEQDQRRGDIESPEYLAPQADPVSGLRVSQRLGESGKLIGERKVSGVFFVLAHVPREDSGIGILPV